MRVGIRAQSWLPDSFLSVSVSPPVGGIGARRDRGENCPDPCLPPVRSPRGGLAYGPRPQAFDQLQPLVPPQVLHFMQVPLRTSV
jgi:hypothetical protein